MAWRTGSRRLATLQRAEHMLSTARAVPCPRRGRLVAWARRLCGRDVGQPVPCVCQTSNGSLSASARDGDAGGLVVLSAPACVSPGPSCNLHINPVCPKVGSLGTASARWLQWSSGRAGGIRTAGSHLSVGFRMPARDGKMQVRGCLALRRSRDDAECCLPRLEWHGWRIHESMIQPTCLMDVCPGWGECLAWGAVCAVEPRMAL